MAVVDGDSKDEDLLKVRQTPRVMHSAFHHFVLQQAS